MPVGIQNIHPRTYVRGFLWYRVKDKKTKEPFPEAMKLLRKLCYENGLIVEVGGYYNNVIRFLPPLTLTKEIAKNGLRIFADANKAMEDSITLLDRQR